MQKPTVYLLCGLTGSGKTTYAKKLEEQGVIRLSIDEKVEELFGTYGVDYPEREWFEKEKLAKEKIDKQLKEFIKDGQSVSLDFGFWKKIDRDMYKQMMTDFGAEWKLLYFKIPFEELKSRLKDRNNEEGSNALTVTGDMLSDFVERFEEPQDEGEVLI